MDESGQGPPKRCGDLEGPSEVVKIGVVRPSPFGGVV